MLWIEPKEEKDAKICKDLRENIYRKHLKDSIITEAVFSDGTEMFLSPSEPKPGEALTIRIRTAVENADKVVLVANGKEYTMEPAEQEAMFDYYRKTIETPKEKLNYYFILQRKEHVCYYCRIGVKDREACEKYPFFVLPGFATPKWAKGAVMYQIFVDRFCNGDTENDVLPNEYYYLNDYVGPTPKWRQDPAATMEIREFFGGDLAGILKKLDYLQELGVEVLYLNPIFVSPSNHKYDTQDYDNIDPHYGVIVNDGGELLKKGETDNTKATRYRTRVSDPANLEASNQLFATLTEELHKRGMRIILDGVFNHCGSFNKWLDREGIYKGVKDYPDGAYASADSPYRSFFCFEEEAWPNNPHYAGWWNHPTLPKLNYEKSPKLEQYILGIAKKWLEQPYGIDGWRLDVAADLGRTAEYNHTFWKKFRKAVKETNSDALILAEHYGDPHDWLQGDEWDSVMNYDAFMEPVTWFLTGMEKHSYESNDALYCNYEHFAGSMNHYMTRFSTPSLQVAMNQLSNHDHSRFMTRTSRKVGRSVTHGPQAANEGIHPAVMREAVVMQFTWPGAPTIYYGDEVGMCGWTDPDNRRAYPWGFEDKELFRFHKEIIRLHKSYEALRTGSVMPLTGGSGVLSYGRFDREDKFVVVVNNNSYATEVAVPAWKTGILENEPVCSLLHTDEYGYGFEAMIYYLQEGILRVPMQPYSAVVLKSIANLF